MSLVPRIRLKGIKDNSNVFNMVAGAEGSAEASSTSRLVETNRLVKMNHYQGNKALSFGAERSAKAPTTKIPADTKNWVKLDHHYRVRLKIIVA